MSERRSNCVGVALRQHLSPLHGGFLSENDVIIRVQNLVRTFGTVTAVSNVTFEVRRGETFAFLGPNGAGKTTTIKMLTTVLRPTSGTLELDGLNPVTESTEVGSASASCFRIRARIAS